MSVNSNQHDAIQEYMNRVYQTSHLVPLKVKLHENGYACYITRRGCLVDDELWVHPDTVKAYLNNEHNPKYVYVFKEKYLSPYSSTQTKRKFKSLAKAHLKHLDLYNK